jgi:predicted transcriptional regulator
MVTISVRIDDELVDRLDELAKVLSARAAGAGMSRSNAVRVALERGVEALEAELGKSRKKR